MFGEGGRNTRRGRDDEARRSAVRPGKERGCTPAARFAARAVHHFQTPISEPRMAVETGTYDEGQRIAGPQGFASCRTTRLGGTFRASSGGVVRLEVEANVPTRKHQGRF
jgi:hypothetical protein